MHPDRPPFLLALSGGSGSGKSTLAEALIARFGPDRAVLLGEDAYYFPLSRYGDPKSEEEFHEITDRIDYDSPLSKEESRLLEDLSALKSGQAINAPIYDYSRHDRSDRTRHIDPSEIILLEGIHALSLPEIAPLIDLSVYVDTPDDLRLARRLRRDVLERGRTVESVLSQYLSTVRPSHYRYTYPAKFQADLVIADEGLPAYGHVCATPAAIERMLAPVLERLANAGIVP